MLKTLFYSWLLDNKINKNGLYKSKRWGRIFDYGDDFIIRVCVQYDQLLNQFLLNQSDDFREMIQPNINYSGCGSCGDKCAFTGFQIKNPTKEQLERIKIMILY
ncbi:MAG: hypothetical protein PHW00_00440 [Clostridia bacterium]|nr:hypothetical protein [Clostridia bacterium]